MPPIQVAVVPPIDGVSPPETQQGVWFPWNVTVSAPGAAPWEVGIPVLRAEEGAELPKGWLRVDRRGGHSVEWQLDRTMRGDLLHAVVTATERGEVQKLLNLLELQNHGAIHLASPHDLEAGWAWSAPLPMRAADARYAGQLRPAFDRLLVLVYHDGYALCPVGNDGGGQVAFNMQGHPVVYPRSSRVVGELAADTNPLWTPCEASVDAALRHAADVVEQVTRRIAQARGGDLTWGAPVLVRGPRWLAFEGKRPRGEAWQASVISVLSRYYNVDPTLELQGAP